jgi:hypothetical protein
VVVVRLMQVSSASHAKGFCVEVVVVAVVVVAVVVVGVVVAVAHRESLLAARWQKVMCPPSRPRPLDENLSPRPAIPRLVLLRRTPLPPKL